MQVSGYYDVTTTELCEKVFNILQIRNALKSVYSLY